jgi:hypothetical protein
MIALHFELKAVARLVEIAGGARFEKPSVHAALIRGYKQLIARADGVIDFDAATRDPNRPVHILAAFDSRDHLHPQDDGYKAVADSVDLKMLTAQP